MSFVCADDKPIVRYVGESSEMILTQRENMVCAFYAEAEAEDRRAASEGLGRAMVGERA